MKSMSAQKTCDKRCKDKRKRNEIWSVGDIVRKDKSKNADEKKKRTNINATVKFEKHTFDNFITSNKKTETEKPEFSIFPQKN